jgi:hypothetical protein
MQDVRFDQTLYSIYVGILVNTHHQLSRPILDIEATTTFLVTLTEGALFALGVLLGVLQVVG